jgi:hypothetical protein
MLVDANEYAKEVDTAGDNVGSNPEPNINLSPSSVSIKNVNHIDYKKC